MKMRRRLLAGLAIVLLAATSQMALSTPASASNLIGGHWAHDGLAHSQIYFVDHAGVTGRSM